MHIKSKEINSVMAVPKINDGKKIKKKILNLFIFNIFDDTYINFLNFSFYSLFRISKNLRK